MQMKKKNECVRDCLLYVIVCGLQDFLWLMVLSSACLHRRCNTLPSFPLNANTQWINSRTTVEA